MWMSRNDINGRSVWQALHCEPAPWEDKRKMFRTVLVLVLCYHTLSQPVTDAPSRREPRQLGECCPCPEVKAEDSVAAGSQRTASDVDDCPCWPQSADSEGSSSLFFPTAVRSGGPLLRTPELKEDPKNLLEPEVTLATSMLDTLREATEEEYQNALARDAARSTSEVDAVQEESARNVVIIVQPPDSDIDDDFIPEASHVQESRCIHPLESSLGRLRSSNPIDVLPETLRFPKSKRPALFNKNTLLNSDNNIGASNVEESIIDINRNTPRYQPHQPLFKTINPLKSILNNGNDGNDDHILKRLPLAPLSVNADNVEKLTLIPKLKLDKLLRKPFQDPIYQNDLRRAFSNNKPELEDTNCDSGNSNGQSFSPLNLRNLLKLRDVELIRKHSFNKPLNEMAIPTVLKSKQNNYQYKDNTDADVYRPNQFITNEEKAIRLSSDGGEIRRGLDECEIEPQAIQVIQENIDTLPSPSLVQQTEIDNDEGRASHFTELLKNQIENQPVSSSIKAKELTTTQIKNQFTNPDVKNEEPLANYDLNTKRDSDTAASNNVLAISPSKIQEEGILDSLPQNQGINEDEKGNPCIKENKISHRSEDDRYSTRFAEAPKDGKNVLGVKELSKTLSSLRENLAKGLEKLRKSSTNAELNTTSKDENNISEKKFYIQKDNRLKCDESNEMGNDFGSIATPQLEGKQNDISILDLQKMSDKLLHSTMNNNNDTDHTDGLSVDGYEQDFGNNFNDNPIALGSPEINLTDDIEAKQDECLDDLMHDNVHHIHEKESIQDEGNKEMDTGASDNFINTLPVNFDQFNNNLELSEPSNDCITMPPIKDPVTSLKKHLGDTLNLDTNISTLDKFKERLGNIFKAKDAENGLSSIQDADDGPIDTMSPEASITNPQRKLPLFKSLDDFTVDIFRNKQPTSMDPSLRTSKLNLNTYGTKVTIPKNLEHAPLNLGSRHKGAREGRLLEFGSERKISARKYKPSVLLGDRLETFPQLEELSNTLRPNTNNLLSKPVHPDLNLFKENARSSDIADITDNIRQNTQNAMKQLQQKMQSTLGKTKTSSLLGDPYAKPQEFLEDVNDKLKVMHEDFNDRLYSIRESILDSPRLRTLVTEPRNRNVMTDLRPTKGRAHPARLQMSPSTISAQEIDPNISTKEREASDNSWRTGHKEHSVLKALTSTRLEDKPITSPLPHLQRVSPLRQNPTIPVMSRERPLSAIKPPSVERLEIPILKKALSPFKDQHKSNKVTISFGTTTVKPAPIASSRTFTPSTQHNKNPSIFPNFQERASGLKERLGSTSDTQLSPSYFNSFRAPTPFILSEEEDNCEGILPSQKSFMRNSNLQSTLHKERHSKQQNSKFNSPKSTRNFDSREVDLNDRISSKTSAKPWSENSFLSKIRDAVATGFTVDSKSSENVESSPDMLRSASRDANTLAAEPLKENVSYRCRMVCTKGLR